MPHVAFGLALSLIVAGTAHAGALGDDPRPDIGTGTDVASVDGASTLDGHLTLDAFPDAPADWWDLAWGHRIKLTFDNSASTETLTDVPVLVVLNPSRWTGTDAGPNGDDLRFIASDGQTVLSYEIDTWAPSLTSYIWVRVPAIAAQSSAGFIWLYYGNSAAPAGADPTSVWSADYAAVWHLGTMTDATSNQNNIAVVSAAAAAPGQIGGGQSFQLSMQSYLGVPDSPSLHLAGTATISGWARQSTVPLGWAWRAMLTRETATGSDDELTWLGFYNGDYQSIFRDANRSGDHPRGHAGTSHDVVVSGDHLRRRPGTSLRERCRNADGRDAPDRRDSQQARIQFTSAAIRTPARRAER